MHHVFTGLLPAADPDAAVEGKELRDCFDTGQENLLQVFDAAPASHPEREESACGCWELHSLNSRIGFCFGESVSLRMLIDGQYMRYSESFKRRLRKNLLDASGAIKVKESSREDCRKRWAPYMPDNRANNILLPIQSDFSS